MDHFKGVIPNERWKNDVLNEMRKIRELLERDAQTVKQTPEKPEKRPYRRKGA